MPEIAWYWQANCSRLVFHLIGTRGCGATGCFWLVRGRGTW